MTILDVILLYLQHMQVMNRATLTIRSARYTLRDFVRFLEDEGSGNAIHAVTVETLTAYQRDIAFRFTARGTPLSTKTQEKLLCDLKGFTKYLCEADYLPADPGRKITLPRQEKRLPRGILEAADIRRMLAACDTQTTLGYRNRVVLELLYDTGIRRAEVTGIKVHDLDLDGGYLVIRHGKGGQDRVVPVSNRVCGLIKSYLLGIRASFLPDKDTGWLIPGDKGRQMNAASIWRIVKETAKLAKLGKGVTTHTFRHTCATHMLKNGAPIRHIQEMLGHASLESTQIYTHVTINDLKQVHAQCHPGETMRR